MSTAAEKIYSHLLDVESLDVLAEEQFFSDDVLAVIPNEQGRKIVRWAVDYYYRSGRVQAPTRDAILERWGDAIEAEEIDLGDGTQNDTIHHLIEQLRINYARVRAQKLLREAAVATAPKVDDNDILGAVGEIADRFSALDRLGKSRRKSQDGPQGVAEAMERYFGRQDSGVAIHGLSFGLEGIDEHLHGVHPGEVCTWAAETGVGKSWLAVRTLWHEFRQGRRCVLFTLENDLPMTFDRVITMGAHVDYERWQEGKLLAPESDRVLKLTEQVHDSAKAFRVEMPPRGQRNVPAMVRKALALGADSIIIDQLTFIEALGKHHKKSDEVAEIMVDLKEMVSEGAENIPVMLLHQINREGAMHARKNGVYLPEHMSYSAEVERTTDFLFAVYQSEMDHRLSEAEFQLIKSRRTKKDRWKADFRVGSGDIRVKYAITEDNAHELELA